MTEREKMLAGELYAPTDTELHSMHLRVQKLFEKYNKIPASKQEKRKKLIKKIFGKTGENVFSNYGAIILDVNKVKIGKNCMLAPNVGIYSATHPVRAEERYNGVELGLPVTIGDNCWIGGGAVICPGVTLGNNVVVGAGSVVTKSFGDNVVIAGNPAKIIREL